MTEDPLNYTLQELRFFAENYGSLRMPFRCLSRYHPEHHELTHLCNAKLRELVSQTNWNSIHN